jgi:hypothetical protein
VLFIIFLVSVIVLEEIVRRDDAWFRQEKLRKQQQAPVSELRTLAEAIDQQGRGTHPEASPSAAEPAEPLKYSS